MKKKLYKLKRHYGNWVKLAEALGVTTRTIRNQMSSRGYTRGFKAVVELELQKIK